MHIMYYLLCIIIVCEADLYILMLLVTLVTFLSANVLTLTYTIRSIVCEASCHPVTWSLGHLVNRSLGHLVTLSISHSVTWSLGHSVTRSLGHSVTWSLGHSVTAQWATMSSQVRWRYQARSHLEHIFW